MYISGPFLILLAMLLTGCFGGEVRPAPETTLSLTIIAGSDSNSGSGIRTHLQNDAAPLQLRMYELQSTELFANADFLDIYLKDSETLQGSLVKKHRLPTVWPNTKKQMNWQLDSETRFIAIFAEFASYQSAVWSVVEPIVPGSQNPMTLQVSGNHLRLSVGLLLDGKELSLNNLPVSPPVARHPPPEKGKTDAFTGRGKRVAGSDSLRVNKKPGATMSAYSSINPENLPELPYGSQL